MLLTVAFCIIIVITNLHLVVLILELAVVEAACSSAGCLYCLLQSCTGMGCLYTCGYRARLRAKYGLSPEPCGDVCVDWCCLPCSLSQQYRELAARGVQADLGTISFSTSAMYSNILEPNLKINLT